MLLLNLVDDSVELAVLRAEDDVVVVLADHVAVRRDDKHVEPVDLVELVALRPGCTGHAGELLVQAEVVLERDRGVGDALLLDLDAFLGLDGLVQAVRPAAAVHQPAGEVVDDDHFAVLDDVLLVAVVEDVRLEGGVDVAREAEVLRGRRGS